MLLKTVDSDRGFYSILQKKCRISAKIFKTRTSSVKLIDQSIAIKKILHVFICIGKIYRYIWKLISILNFKIKVWWPNFLEKRYKINIYQSFFLNIDLNIILLVSFLITYTKSKRICTYQLFFSEVKKRYNHILLYYKCDHYSCAAVLALSEKPRHLNCNWLLGVH